jgi:hypothetical protein
MKYEVRTKTALGDLTLIVEADNEEGAMNKAFYSELGSFFNLAKSVVVPVFSPPAAEEKL